MGYFKRARKKVPKLDTDGNLPADSLLVMSPEITKDCLAKTQEIVKEVEKDTPYTPMVIFAMFHGLRPLDCLAWVVNDWHLEDWKHMMDNSDGFVPFGHIAVIPIFETGSYLTKVHLALEDYWSKGSQGAVQSRVDKALDVADWTLFTNRVPTVPPRPTLIVKPAPREPESPEVQELRRKAEEIYPFLANRKETP